MIYALLDDDAARLCLLGNVPGTCFAMPNRGNDLYLIGVYDGTSIGHPEANGYRVLVQGRLPALPPPRGTQAPPTWDLAYPQPAPVDGVYQHLVTAPSDTDDPRVCYLPYRARTDPSVVNPLTCLHRWRNVRGGYGDPDGDWDVDEFGGLVPWLTLDSQYFWGTGNFMEGVYNSSFYGGYITYGYFDPTIANDAVRALSFDADSYVIDTGPPPTLGTYVSPWTLDTPVLSNHSVLCAGHDAADTRTGVWSAGTRKAAAGGGADPARTAAWAGCIWTPGLFDPPAGHRLDLDGAPGVYSSGLNHLWFWKEWSIYAVGWQQAERDGDRAPLLYHFDGTRWTDCSAFLPIWPWPVAAPVTLDLVGLVQRGFAGTLDDNQYVIQGWIDAPDAAGAARRVLAWEFREQVDGTLDRWTWAGFDLGESVLPVTNAAIYRMCQDVTGTNGMAGAGSSCGHWATFQQLREGGTYPEGWVAGIVQL